MRLEHLLLVLVAKVGSIVDVVVLHHDSLDVLRKAESRVAILDLTKHLLLVLFAQSFFFLDGGELHCVLSKEHRDAINIVRLKNVSAGSQLTPKYWAFIFWGF